MNEMDGVAVDSQTPGSAAPAVDPREEMLKKFIRYKTLFGGLGGSAQPMQSAPQMGGGFAGGLSSGMNPRIQTGMNALLMKLAGL